MLFSVGGLFALSSMVDLKYEKLDTQVKKQSERQFELEEEHAVSQLTTLPYPAAIQQTGHISSPYSA